MPQVQDPGEEKGIAAPSPTAFAAAIISHLAQEGALAKGTLSRMLPIIDHLGRFLESGCGIQDMDQVRPHHAQAFLDARHTNGQQATYSATRQRRTALRRAFKTGRSLGMVKGDPSLDVVLAGPGSLATRPVTADEVERCRSFAEGTMGNARRPIALALAEAMARTSEMGLVLVEHVDVAQRRVWLSGSPRTDPRWGYLTGWGVEQVARRLERGLEPESSLIAWRTPPKNLRAASTQAVVETFRAASISDPRVRPASVVKWAGRQLLDEHISIDRVTLRLGMGSLDEAAGFLGYDWHGGAGER